jgi:predicted nucleic acid-binding protein
VKVVFDTNVLVSALVFPGGPGEEALLRVVAERDELVLSRSILALKEYRGVRVLGLADYLESP